MRIILTIFIVFSIYLRSMGQSITFSIDTLYKDSISQNLLNNSESYLFSVSENYYFIVTDNKGLLINRNNPNIKEYIFWDSYCRFKKVAFNSKDQILLEDSNENLIYVYDLLLKKKSKIPLKNPQIWYSNLNPYYNIFFEGITWYPVFKYNDWYKKEHGTRFDYGLSMTLTADSTIYLINNFIVEKVFQNNAFLFDAENTFLSNGLSFNSSILKIDSESNIFYTNGSILIKEKLSTGVMNKLDLAFNLKADIIRFSSNNNRIYILNITTNGWCKIFELKSL